MQVSLKQSELTAAVRQYIAKQGINLVGKDVEVKFSATRGDAGIMATIDIDDVDLPELTPNVRPTLQVVNAAPLMAIAANPVVEQPSPFDVTQVEDAATLVPVDDEPKAKGTSLFA